MGNDAPLFVPLRVTDEMRREVHREDCRKRGHDINQIMHRRPPAMRSRTTNTPTRPAPRQWRSSGGSTAPEESVRARLEAEFGPKRAAEILGDITPPARRNQVPAHVGRKPERGTTWANKDAGSPRTLSWKEQRDAGRDQPLSVRLLVAKTGSVTCVACGGKIAQGGEFLRFSYNASQRSYCPPCGTPLARGTDLGAVATRVLVACTVGVACLAAVVLCALAIATAGIEQSERFLWGAVLAVVVAVALGIFGAVTWGNTPDEP